MTVTQILTVCVGLFELSGLLGEGDGPILKGLGVETEGLSGDPNLSSFFDFGGGFEVIK